MTEFLNSLDWGSIYIWATIAVLVLFLFGMFASWKVHATFNKYSNEYVSSTVTGKAAARKLLDDAGLFDVQIMQSGGKLSDHYDPTTRTVALSDEVSNSSSIASLAVAAHEVGHAIQHGTNYAYGTIRKAMVPVVNIMSRAYYIFLVVGIIFGYMNPASPLGWIMLWIGLVFFASSMLFALVTLPTEFDASNRALRMLTDSGIVVGREIKGAKKVLRAAAMTYVVAFLIALAQFIRLLAIVMSHLNSSRRR